MVISIPDRLQGRALCDTPLLARISKRRGACVRWLDQPYRPVDWHLTLQSILPCTAVSDSLDAGIRPRIARVLVLSVRTMRGHLSSPGLLSWLWFIAPPPDSSRGPRLFPTWRDAPELPLLSGFHGNHLSNLRHHLDCLSLPLADLSRATSGHWPMPITWLMRSRAIYRETARGKWCTGHVTLSPARPIAALSGGGRAPRARSGGGDNIAAD